MIFAGWSFVDGREWVKNFSGFLILFWVRKPNGLEGIFVIVLLRNFLKLFLIMAKWRFFFGFSCFSFEQPNGKRIIYMCACINKYD